jgi:hypothetical protein
MILKLASMTCIKYLVFLLFVTSAAVGQPDSTWLKGKQWKLYDVGPQEVYDLKADSLAKLASGELSTDTVISFLKDATIIPKDRSTGVVWMGSFWVSYLAGQRASLLRVSRYGGFFMDENDGGYYELPVWETPQWLAFFTHAAVELQLRANFR